MLKIKYNIISQIFYADKLIFEGLTKMQCVHTESQNTIINRKETSSENSKAYELPFDLAAQQSALTERPDLQFNIVVSSHVRVTH